MLCHRVALVYCSVCIFVHPLSASKIAAIIDSDFLTMFGVIILPISLSNEMPPRKLSLHILWCSTGDSVRIVSYNSQPRASLFISSICLLFIFYLLIIERNRIFDSNILTCSFKFLFSSLSEFLSSISFSIAFSNSLYAILVITRTIVLFVIVFLIL